MRRWFAYVLWLYMAKCFDEGSIFWLFMFRPFFPKPRRISGTTAEALKELVARVFYANVLLQT